MTSTRSDNVSTSQGACVFCNTVRAVDEVLCPDCGRGWIDASAIDSAESVARAEVAAMRTISASDAPRVGRSSYRKAWWVPVLVAGAVFGAYWMIVTILGTADSAGSGGIATPPTTTVGTDGSLQTPPTTLAATGAPTTVATTGGPTTTTGAPATTTTVPLPAGAAVPLDDLRLGAVELGAFPFGMDVDELLPRLVGTFGQPTAITTADEDHGLCRGSTGRVITFAGLHIVTLQTDDTETFAGFALEPAGPRTDRLVTFSGVGLGTTIAEMADTYRAFQAEPADAGTSWVVSSFNDGRTLLWGTARGTGPNAAVDRIVSPRACDGGPASG